MSQNFKVNEIVLKSYEQKVVGAIMPHPEHTTFWKNEPQKVNAHKEDKSYLFIIFGIAITAATTATIRLLLFLR